MSFRELECTRCHEIIGVHEPWGPAIDPHRYICGHCLGPVSQPELVEAHRVETPSYNPDQADIGF